MSTPGDSPTQSPLVKNLGLLKHPEGGYFLETDRQTREVPSPFVEGAPRSLATSIYYLLDYDSPNGVIHMNKSFTYHVLHEGRAEYTLVHPPTSPNEEPRFEKKVMGTNLAAGETRLLLVDTGVWKMSKLLPADIEAAKDTEAKKKVRCLITEVVVPGFHWEDHKFLTKSRFDDLLAAVKDEKERDKWRAELKSHVKQE